jgi:predicted amidohydrolase
MKIGLVQTSPVFGDKKANQEQIEALVGKAQADLWIMPELALTGYEFLDRGELFELAEEIPDGPSAKWLVQFCADRNCHAVMGLAERDGHIVYNSCVLASPQGIVGRYRKLHLFERETELFAVGNLPLPVVNIGQTRVGLMICFDWRYPEVARTLTLRGAQILAHPSNLVMPFCQKAMVTRALENRVFCTTVNRIGTEKRAGREVAFTGESQIISPAGKELASLPVAETGIAVAEIDPREADDKHTSRYNDLIADRKPEFYD